MAHEHAPKLQPSMVFHQSDNLDFVCYAKVIGVDGRFIDFSIDRDLAFIMMIELTHHLKRHAERKDNAPVQIPPKQA